MAVMTTVSEILHFFCFYVDVVKSYQNFACSANIPGKRGRHEYALHLLQTCNGHIKVNLNTFVLHVAQRLHSVSSTLVLTTCGA